MNNQSPLVPQGSNIDQKNKGRARVKIAVFFVLAVHGVGLLALLLQGCHREDANQQAGQSTNATPSFDVSNAAPVVADVPTPPTNAQPAVAESTNNAPSAPAAAASDYVVAKGDSFAIIAKKFALTTKAVMDANPGVEPTKLQIGQKLHIPAATKVATTMGANPTAPATDPAGGDKVYSVKSGDTLIKIASEHHVTVRALRSANNLRTDSIRVGQKLKLPTKGIAATPAPTETALNTASAVNPTR